MRNSRKAFVVVVLVIGLLAMVVGCAAPSTPTPTPTATASSPTPTPTTPPPGGDIIIGCVAPLTGDSATFGKSTQNGVQQALDETNAKGGLLGGRQLILKTADDKSDPTEGAAGITRLIEQDKIVAEIGTVQSKVSLAIAPILQAKKIPMVSPTSTNEKVTLVGDFIFRACFIDNFQGTVGAAFAYTNLKVTKAAALFDVGNDYTKGLAESFRDAFTLLGGTIVGFEAHPTGATDFNAQLTKLIAAGPELLYLSDYYNDVGLICKQARALGYKGYFLGGDGWDSPDLVKIGGADVEGGFFTNHFSKDDTRPEVQTFVKAYTAKYGEAPDALAALAYDAANLMLDAITRAGSTDGTAIRDALKTSNFKAVSGTIKFDANRNPIKAAVIIEIKGGQQAYKATVAP
ncbi:MAG: ABC transporter substrate-binding protein [Coprothermobacterota bacterium]|nr:ABC transporter substrate-binding protein [Coprothermobacterota bacterium]